MKKYLGIIFFIYILFAMSIISHAKGWADVGGEWKYEVNDGEYLTDSMKKSGNDTYYLDANGDIAKDYLLEENNNIYYFGADGKMITNAWVTFKPEDLEDLPFEADAYFMYFGTNGKAIRSDDGKVKAIDGKTYMFNDRGIMMVGWLTKEGEFLDFENGDDWYSENAVYYAHEDGSLCEGWLAVSDYYTLEDEEFKNAGGDVDCPEKLYFYFDIKNHKKVQDTTRVINGKKYAFRKDNGRMYAAWDYMEDYYKNDSASSIGTDGEHNITIQTTKNKFYNDPNDGSLVKNEWIYTVPSAIIDSEKYDDEEKHWFFARNDGSLVVNQEKRINNKKYIFDKRGIMKTGLVILRNEKYFADIDLEKTSYDDFVKLFTYYPSNTRDGELGLNDQEKVESFYMMRRYDSGLSIKYYGDDGACITGDKISIPFSDGEHEFYSTSHGAYAEWKKEKYYVNGFLMKAEKGDKYGLFVDFFTCTDNGTGGLTEMSQFAPKLLIYGNVLVDIVSAMGATPEMVEGWFAAKGYPKWYAYLPLGRLAYEKGHNDNSGNHNQSECTTLGLTKQSILQEVLPAGAPNMKRTGNTAYVVDEKGKVKDKGAYYDGYNYWVVDKGKKFIGYFNVPIKWIKVNGVDTPHYKSDLLTYDEDGNEKIKRGAWIPFGTKDSHGYTEANYNETLEDFNCLNFVLGDYDPT